MSLSQSPCGDSQNALAQLPPASVLMLHISNLYRFVESDREDQVGPSMPRLPPPQMSVPVLVILDWKIWSMEGCSASSTLRESIGDDDANKDHEDRSRANSERYEVPVNHH